MEPKFLEFYNQELKFIREMAAEFAIEYPKIASRLGIDGFDCADPYVERLLEGFAFLSARVHLKLDASFPKFTQHLLELIFPGFLQPSPSILLAQIKPDYDQGSLLEGAVVSKGTLLHSVIGKEESTVCKYSLVNDVELWPLQFIKAEYLTSQTISSVTANSSYTKRAKSGVILTLEVPEGVLLSELSVDVLPIHLRGSESFPSTLYESLIKGFIGVMYREQGISWCDDHQCLTLTPLGLNSDEPLLPILSRQFDGFRLLREYFLFERKFLGVKLSGLQSIFKKLKHRRVELLLLLEHFDARLDNLLSVDNFQLYCSPAVNLFQKKAERINLTQTEHEFHVVADRIRPLDYEVSQVLSVEGYISGTDTVVDFYPLYQQDKDASGCNYGFFSLTREVRKRSEKQVKFGHRSSYIGSEVYISIVEPQNAPFSQKLKQLSVNTLCSNRDLALIMPLGKGTTDFTIDTGAPCASIRCLGEPTRPQPSLARGSFCWELIQQLAINFLGFTTDSSEKSTMILKRLLSLLVDPTDSAGLKQIEGIVSVSAKLMTRRVPIPGPICFARGLEVSLTVDKEAFEGGSAFVLASVLDVFFAEYVSINSFTQLVLLSNQEGEIYRWKVRTGQQLHA